MDHKQVANFDAKLVRRDRRRSAFWVEMERPTQEIDDIPYDLFDIYGCLERDYYGHLILEGSGVRAWEFDHGDILVIDVVYVKPLWRHQGIGTKIVEAILDKARAMSSAFFAFAEAGYIAGGPGCVDKEDLDVAQKLAISEHFWLSLGFREVGRSRWFAFTDGSSHPFRHLGAAKRPEYETLPEPVWTVLSILSDPSDSDVECAHQIQEAFPVDAAALARPYIDKNGNTVLHIAAMGRKAAAISYILAKYPLLSGIRNAEGHTPLEAVQSRMEEYRTRQDYGGFGSVGSNQFKGYSQSAIACLAAFAGNVAFDLTTLSEQDISAISSATDKAASGILEINKIRYTLQLKYGCTCGECIGGILSPRMRFALLGQAEFEREIPCEGLYASNQCWVESHMHALRYLATPVRKKLETNKVMRQGFVNMCGHIAGCLKKRRLPDEETVLQFYHDKTSERPPVTKNYLERGGTVAAVAMMLFQRAMNPDEWALGGRYMGWYKDGTMDLPACRNDHEFDFVRAMCGY